MSIFAEMMEFIHNGKDWFYPACSIVVITFLAYFLVSLILRKLYAKSITTHNIWDESFIGASIAPAKLIIWITGVFLLVHLLESQKIITSKNWVPHFISSFYILIATWFLLRFISRLEKLALTLTDSKKIKDPTTIIAIGKLARIIISILSLLTIMQTIGYSISGLLAFGGIGGLAVSFAAKDLLANFFGGLMIYTDAPFKVGEWIRAPGKPIEGTVEYIGWRQTRIRTFDRRPLYVPNSMFVSMAIENPGRMENRRIKTTIGIRYEDSGKLETLLKAIREFIKNHPDIDKKRTTFIYFNNFSHSSLDCQLYCFTKTTDWIKWLAIQEKIYLEIINIIHKHGADIAFPVTKVEWPEGVKAMECVAEYSGKKNSAIK